MTKGRSYPERTCVFCGKKFPKEQLIRFVRLEDKIIVDQEKKSSGRGAYLCKDCFPSWESSSKLKKLERALWKSKKGSS